MNTASELRAELAQVFAQLKAGEIKPGEAAELANLAGKIISSAGVGGKMAEVVRFLMGEAPLEGRWFDEPDPHVGGAYWWRKHLTEALAQQPAATSETVNVIGMPEFDGLLDHIYEHGTAAEGVIEKANAFARAVIARYAPQQPAGRGCGDGGARHVLGDRHD